MEPLKQNYKKIFSLKQAKKIIIWLFLVIIFDLVFFSSPSIAQASVNIEENADFSLNLLAIENDQEIVFDLSQEEKDIANMVRIQEVPDIINTLPRNEPLKAISSRYHSITAYNSEVGQTDNSPCITANGFDVCKHGKQDTVAANFLPFGTKVRIPAIFGDKVFIVRDRMNSRYQERMDIWMLEKTNALKFGVKIAKIEVLE